MNSKIKDLLERIYCIIIALVIAILIKYYLGTPTVVQMDSMYPTLVQGDRLILNRIPKTNYMVWSCMWNCYILVGY